MRVLEKLQEKEDALVKVCEQLEEQSVWASEHGHPDLAEAYQDAIHATVKRLVTVHAQMQTAREVVASRKEKVQQ